MKKTNTEIILLPGDSVESARDCFSQGAAKIMEGCQIVYRLYQRDPAVVNQFITGPGAYPEKFIAGALRVGAGELHPTIFLNRCPAYRQLMLMTYATQEAAIEKGVVELVVGPEPRDVIKVDLVKLEGKQVEQALSSAGLRSCDEQRAWLRRKNYIAPASTDAGPPYAIKRGRLVILRGNFELSKIELLRILEQMEAA